MPEDHFGTEMVQEPGFMVTGLESGPRGISWKPRSTGAVLGSRSEEANLVLGWDESLSPW